MAAKDFPGPDPQVDKRARYVRLIALGVNNSDASDLSWVWEDLIRKGDIYAPQRGHVMLAVPIFAPTSSPTTNRPGAPPTPHSSPLEQLRRNAAHARTRELPAADPGDSRS